MTDPTTVPDQVDVDHKPGTVAEIDPHQLIIAANVRSNVAIEKPFLESIKAHGVLVPISVWWDDLASAWQVLDGQRRTLAARELALKTVPVWVVPKIAGEDQRIVGQLTVNDHRKAIDDADEGAALHQLALFGMSADTIRKKTSIPRARVKQALAVSAAPAAAKILAEQPITLENAAALAAFADEPDVLAELATTATKEPNRLAWALERAQEKRRDRDALAAARAELSAAGKTVVDARPERPALNVRQLARPDGGIVEEHEWSVVDDLVVHPEVFYGGQVHPVYFVLDPAKHGWRDRWTGSSTSQAAKPTKEERKAARAAAADWRTATTLRTDFLRTLVSNPILRNVPVIARILALHLAARLPHRSYTDHQGAIALLNLTPPTTDTYKPDSDRFGYATWLEQNPTRALNLAAAIALADIESALASSNYEKPQNGGHPSVARYLRLVADLGHTLSSIEQHAAGIEPDTSTH